MRLALDKIATQDTLRERIAALARPLVFTNGCFDLIHRGHIDYLEKARGLGASLVVGINDDESVRRLGKSENRPINPISDRSAVLAALECVDLVIEFSEDTPLHLIETVRPDILAKGGDWAVENIVGAEFVQREGGSVHSIPILYPHSTTELIARIRQ